MLPRIEIKCVAGADEGSTAIVCHAETRTKLLWYDLQPEHADDEAKL